MNKVKSFGGMFMNKIIGESKSESTNISPIPSKIEQETFKPSTQSYSV